MHSYCQECSQILPQSCNRHERSRTGLKRPRTGPEPGSSCTSPRLQPSFLPMWAIAPVYQRAGSARVGLLQGVHGLERDPRRAALAAVSTMVTTTGPTRRSAPGEAQISTAPASESRLTRTPPSPPIVIRVSGISRSQAATNSQMRSPKRRSSSGVTGDQCGSGGSPSSRQRSEERRKVCCNLPASPLWPDEAATPPHTSIRAHKGSTLAKMKIRASRS